MNAYKLDVLIITEKNASKTQRNDAYLVSTEQLHNFQTKVQMALQGLAHRETELFLVP